MIRAVLLAMALTACGREPAINGDLQAAVDRYLAHVPTRGHYDDLVSVDWGETTDGAQGQCLKAPRWDGSLSRKVRIVRSDYDAVILDALVAHELGHCLHDKVHDNSVIPKLMNTYMVQDTDYWTQHLDEQIEAMF